MQFKSDWAETRDRFSAWWAHKKADRPLLSFWTYRECSLENPLIVEPFADVSERYLYTEKMLAHQFERLCTQKPMAEAYPALSLDLGAGSLALYLGSEPDFHSDTLWFLPAMDSLPSDGNIPFNADSRWFKQHIEMFEMGKEIAASTDALLCIPDLVEHVDVLASLRGTTELFHDFYEYPDLVKAANKSLNMHYKTIYDAFNKYCMEEDTGWNAFTIFSIYGPGRTGKVQCDVSAMISPDMFREFALEPLREQCKWLDNSLFHLDGPECICHVPALMEIEELNAIQWTHGHSNPPSGEECWDELYSMVRDADKGLWIALFDYDPEVAIQKADRLVRKFGAKGLYFLLPNMTEQESDALLLKAEREWKC